MKKRLLTILFVLGCLFSATAQQDFFFTQQTFSRGNINPAGVGNTGDVDLFLLGRLQWLGVDNAPHTILLNATNYFQKIQSGVGLSLSYDALGIGHSTTEIKAEYSYQIDLNPNWILSMGISAGMFLGIYDPSANTLEQEAERMEKEKLQAGKEKEITPNFDLGFEINRRNLTLGVSCTHIQNNASTSYSSDRHIYAYSIFTQQLNKLWDLMIDLGYMNRNKVHLADLGVLAFYNRLFWGGFSWRPDLINGCNPSYLSILVGFEYHIVRFGYIYECGLGTRSTLPSNTHEILLSFRIPKKEKSID